MSNATENEAMQSAMDSLRPDGAPWRMVQDWKAVPDTADPVVEEQVWQHAKTDETITNQRGRPETV